MIVSYEDICSDPAAVISQLLSFLNLNVSSKQYRAAKRFVVHRDVIRRLERKIRRNELIKAGFYQFCKNPIVFFVKLVKHIGINRLLNKPVRHTIHVSVVRCSFNTLLRKVR